MGRPSCRMLAIPAILAVLAAIPAVAAPEMRTVDSVQSLREAMARSNQRIRMKPGIYTATDALEDNKTVFLVSGSNNRFDLRGVTIQVDTRVLGRLRGGVHDFATYRITGDNNTFLGATFEDIGDTPPHWGLSTLHIRGNDTTVRDCRLIVRGSAPFGYGNLWGKGAGAAVRLQKHAGMAVFGDRTLIESCRLEIHTFGHGIHMHGAQNTVIRHTVVEGELRTTDDILTEKGGLAEKFNYKIMYPKWLKGDPIPPGKMIALGEDGIRAYVYDKRNGKNVRTGHIAVVGCTVRRMRGGIGICAANSGIILDSQAIDCADYGFSVPNGGVVRNCRANAAYGLVLSNPYPEHRNADIEIDVVPSERELGDHPLARVVGRGHRIRLHWTGDKPPATLRPIELGLSNRYNARNTKPEDLPKRLGTDHVRLENDTPCPVTLSQYTSECIVVGDAPVTEQGKGNLVIKMPAE